MIVRPVEARDRSAWDALYGAYAQFYEVPQTPQMRAQVWDWLTDPNHEVNGLVAGEDGSLLGFAHYRPFARPLAAASGLYLDDLFVAPPARGTGAAQALIAAVRQAAEDGGHSIVRWITARDNTRARKVYDALAEETAWVTYDIKL